MRRGNGGRSPIVDRDGEERVVQRQSVPQLRRLIDNVDKAITCDADLKSTAVARANQHCAGHREWPLVGEYLRIASHRQRITQLAFDLILRRLPWGFGS